MERSRPATVADVPRVAALARALHTELAPTRGGPQWAAREARAEPLEAAFATLLEDAEARLVVGLIDDTVVGFGTVEVELLRTGARLGRIAELYVEPGAREVGVGEAMAAELLAFCAEQGCSGVDVPALPGHRAAKNFLEEQGFTARALVMHRRLDPPAP